MKRAALLLFLFAACAQAAPVNVIFDTDMSGDVDDVGALAVLNKLDNLGEAHLLACVSCVGIKEKAIGGCIKAINTYYGNGAVPIGTYRGTKYTDFDSRYTAKIRDEFAKDEPLDDQLPSAVEVYRKALAAAPDGSVTVVTVGFLGNLPALLQSPADAISPFVGLDLVKSKVAKLVIMGGRNPCGQPEVNLSCHNSDGEWSRYVSLNWPGPILFVGSEIGDLVKTGGEKLKACAMNNPVRRAYELFNSFAGRGSWDPTATIAAVRDPKLYWDVKTGGFMEIKPDGTNIWHDTPDHNNSVVAWRRVPSTAVPVTDALNDLMTASPGPAK